uniref:Uncharacterized protein n=1 Tax=Lactuca sativa TaxID=4236 RepID=A0A9R1UX03_LACSA|nr:hypothetical protein LSAT_V11C700343420 [Lactuca sativa]
MWDAIKTRNLGANRVKEARLQTLIIVFENLKMSDTSTIDDFASKLSEIASKSASLGEVMTEHKLVKKFLMSLPRRFIHIVASLQQVLDLNKIGFEDVVGRPKTYEKRIKGEDKNKLLYSKIELSNRNTESSRGEVEVQIIKEKDMVVDVTVDVVGLTPKIIVTRNPIRLMKIKSQSEKNVNKGISQIFNKYGHLALRYLDQIKNHEAKLNETYVGGTNHEKRTFFMMNTIQEKGFLKEDRYIPPKIDANIVEDEVCYLDNGAINHMTGNYSYFLN